MAISRVQIRHLKRLKQIIVLQPVLFYTSGLSRHDGMKNVWELVEGWHNVMRQQDRLWAPLLPSKQKLLLSHKDLAQEALESKWFLRLPQNRFQGSKIFQNLLHPFRDKKLPHQTLVGLIMSKLKLRRRSTLYNFNLISWKPKDRRHKFRKETWKSPMAKFAASLEQWPICWKSFPSPNLHHTRIAREAVRCLSSLREAPTNFTGTNKDDMWIFVLRMNQLLLVFQLYIQQGCQVHQT